MNETEHTFWYLTRASGIVAYLLLFVAVMLGLSLTGGVLERWLRRYRVYDFHRFLSLITLGVTAFHVLIVLPDGFIGFSVAELLVPFASPYRPLYMALGTFAFYVVALVIVSFYLLPLLRYRVWRLLHFGTFGAFTLALVHGIGAGTDTEAAWAGYLYAATGLIVFNLLVYRVVNGEARGIPRAAEATPAAAQSAVERR